ncbi:MAG: PorP/SprF family type IX secretion system membrane protein [Bacteroidales bacterium]|nr:PorP/SprF family type IX secretion system membrane protein [Bacteroidales bacterium]
MSKKIVIQIIAFITVFSSVLNAQELKNYNLYNQNPVLYNPAYAIGDNFLMAYSNSHLQWISMAGAPRTYDIGATMNFFPGMGAGFSVVSSQQGLFNNLYANLKYGYQLNFDENHYVKMGVSFGIINNRVLSQNAENVDLTDENLTGDYFNKTVFSSGFGLAYKFKDISAQIILPQLFEYNIANLYTIGVVAYDYHLNESWDIKPSVMFRGAKETPFQFDGNIGTTWNKTIWGQVGYRSNNSLIFGVGVNINSYSIGYAYQADMNPIASGSWGSHEIQLILILNNGEKTLFIPKVHLFGIVTSNIDGKPIVAQMIIYEDKSQVEKITTDSKTGNYASDLDYDRTYKIKITARGHQPKEEMITLTKDMKELEHNIVLISNDALVSGKISNKLTGSPVESEVVFMENNRVVKTVQTDENGDYSAVLKTSRTYNIKVSADNFEAVDSEVEVEKNAEKITKNFELNPNLVLTGQVTDAKTGVPIAANIDLYNYTTNELVANVTADEDGNYSINLPDINSFSISISADKYLFHTENFKTDFSDFESKKDFVLQPIEVGSSIVLRNIFFDTGKSDLRPESYTELNRLVYVMMENPDLKLEVSGHTDNTGTVAFNNQLSKDRAQSVVNYMISKGIKKERLKAEGYGSSKPIDTNDTEEGKQNNRRVEAEIVN